MSETLGEQQRQLAPAAGERLARIGATFLAGYRAGLLDPRPARLLAALGRVPVGWRAFAGEGAGFAPAAQAEDHGRARPRHPPG